MNSPVVIHANSSQLATINSFSPELYQRFISFLDVMPKTAETYSKALKRLFKYLAENQISEPTRTDLIAFRDELKASTKASTVKTYFTATRLFFRWLEQEGLYKNIADKIKGAKVEHGHKKDALTIDQVKDVIGGFSNDSSTNKRDYAVFVLMVTCGLRTIEVARADIEDLRTLGSKTVLYVQGKGKEEKSEYVIITRETEKAIRAYLATRTDASDKAPLFCSSSNNSKGERLSTRTISGLIKASLQAVGLNSTRLTAHSLRHTAVTLSLLGGSTLQEARQFARHTNIATTEIYAHNLERIANPCEGIITSSIFS